MRTRILIEAGATALGCLMLLGGCAVTPPPTPLERDFGLSHHLAIYGQIANPAAEENLGLVEGIEGKLSLGALWRYRKTFDYDTVLDSNKFDLRPVYSGPAIQPSTMIMNNATGSSSTPAAPLGPGASTTLGTPNNPNAPPESRGRLP